MSIVTVMLCAFVGGMLSNNLPTSVILAVLMGACYTAGRLG